MRWQIDDEKEPRKAQGGTQDAESETKVGTEEVAERTRRPKAAWAMRPPSSWPTGRRLRAVVVNAHLRRE